VKSLRRTMVALDSFGWPERDFTAPGPSSRLASISQPDPARLCPTRRHPRAPAQATRHSNRSASMGSSAAAFRAG
jgi:hypothetical protein